MPRFALAACLALGFLALAAPARAGCPNAPLQFAKAAVSGNGDAVEHVTIRGRTGPHDTFIRFSMTNAGFKRGELFVAFRQETAGGTLYGEQAFARGDYTVSADKLGIRAGKHSLEVANGQLVAAFDFGNLQASVALTSHAAAVQVADRGGDGFVMRELLVPTGRLLVKARNAARPAGTSLPRCTRSARRFRSASTAKSPRACADFTTPNVYFAPGTARSTASSQVSCKKTPVFGPPL